MTDLLQRNPTKSRTVVAVWVLCALLALPSQSQFLRQVHNSKITPWKRSIAWPNRSFSDVTLKLHFPAHKGPTSLLIGRDHPNGTRLLAFFPGYAVHLPVSFGSGPDFNPFDEYGELKQGYSLQAAEHDFDGDGCPEIVVVAGDDVLDLVVNVLKYRVPRKKGHTPQQSDWSLIGTFTGQRKVDIEKNTITLPFGSQGLFDQYNLVKGKFVKVN